MFLAECLKLSIPVVNVQFSACNSRGIKRRCLSLELQDRSSYAIGAKSAVRTSSRKGVWQQRTQAMYVDDDDEGYLVDAPVSQGDGFSFTGGKYSDEMGRADEWYARGKIVNAYPVEGRLEKAKDPLFGLAMGEASQISSDSFRWFYVEEGDQSKPSILLVHGIPSQAYSFRKVIPELSADYHVIAFDWLGFGFSDKPQPKYGFNYTTAEYAAALGLLVDALGLKDFTLVVQGFFVPAALQYAKANEARVNQLILINPPVKEQHAKLPSSLAAFSTFLLGDIFAQDPLKASDKPLTECGPYQLDEEDAMVYRRPYLTSGASGFALTAISQALKSELQASIRASREMLCSKEWRKPVSIIWGLKDRWLDFRGVEDFAKLASARLVQLPEVGHHAQEDFGEEVGKVLKTLLKQASVV
ncbi:unnamed protein product [Sphagnum balticum]